eukprot:4822487-Amphidinium_carterae.2
MSGGAKLVPKRLRSDRPLQDESSLRYDTSEQGCKVQCGRCQRPQNVEDVLPISGSQGEALQVRDGTGIA